jgi:hypothetical protein
MAWCGVKHAPHVTSKATPPRRRGVINGAFKAMKE